MIDATPSAQRVLVLGLDGATFDVLEPLAEQGVMPNMKRLMRTSATARLESCRPTVTPVAWTTFQTGCQPEHHGILDYRYFDHHHGRMLLNHADRIDRPTLFDVVAAHGGRVVSLNLPMTYPAPRSVPGIIVGGVDSVSIEAVLKPYPEFARRLIASSAEYNLATIWRRRPLDAVELAAGVEQTEMAFRGRAVAARLADEMTDWSLMVVQFQTLDSLQHRCWHLFGIDETSDAAPRDVAQVHRAMRTLDNCLGDLLELADQRDAIVVVVSDHGFGTFREKISVPRLLMNRGLVVHATAAERFAYRVQRTQWKILKWISRQMRPGQSMAGLERPVDLSLPIDWRKSVATPVHGSLASLIYLNTPQRFGIGQITNQRLYDQAAADTVGALREARHPLTDEALFDDVFLVGQRFNCNPLEHMWPDLIGIPAPGFHTRHKFDARPEVMRSDPTLTGTHRLDGVLILAAPGAQRMRLDSAELRDMAPTILHLMGYARGEQMTGRILSELLPRTQSVVPEPHFLNSRPMPATAEITTAEQHAVEQRLRELGYMD